MAAQAGERLRKLIADDFLGIYFQPLEERLVEQAALLRHGGQVGPLHVLGQRQGGLQGVEDLAVIHVQLVNALLGTGPLAPDARLLLGEQLGAHLVGIVSLEQLPLLASEPRKLGLGLGDLLVQGAGFLPHVGANGLANAVAVLVGELHVLARAVVALDRGLHGSRPVVALLACAVTAATAREVVVGAAVALGSHPGQPAAALRTEQAAA